MKTLTLTEDSLNIVFSSQQLSDTVKKGLRHSGRRAVCSNSQQHWTTSLSHDTDIYKPRTKQQYESCRNI